MTGSPKLSVCVPTYNRADYLSQALRALSSQTFTEFELLVVDNCSTDGTAALVESFGDQRIRFHRNERNVGSRENWNRCLDLASGEYIAICHDDDLYEPDFLRRGVGLLDANPGVAFVHTAVRVVDEEGRPLRVFRAYQDDKVIPGREAFVGYLSRSHDVVMSSVIARRASYEAVERFTPDYLCADFEMWLRLALQGDVAYIATPLVSYRTHAESTSREMDPARWYRENEEIVRRAVKLAAGTIPGIVEREDEFVLLTRRLWARRTLTQAFYSASFGHLSTARGYFKVSRELAQGASGAWRWRLAALLMNPLGAEILRGVRLARRGLRRGA